MNITQDIAYPIIKRLSQTVKHNINIIDQLGVIIASTDQERLNVIHEGARKVLETKKALIIYQEQIGQFSGTKEGVNLPIEFMEEIIGVVGITGNPNELLQLAEMTKITVELMLQQNYIRKQTDVEQQLMESWVIELISSNVVEEKRLLKHAKHFLNINLSKDIAVCLLNIPQLHSENNLEGFIRRNELKDEIYRLIARYKLEFNVLFYGTTVDYDLVIGLEVNSFTTELAAANQLLNRLVNQNKQLFSNAKLAIGNRNNSVQGLRQSFAEARQSLHLMSKFKKNAISSQVNEWGMIRLLDRVPTEIRKEFLEQYPIMKLPPDLHETLKELFECDHNLTETAKRLHIHRNTLTYRIESIRQLLKLNPKSGNDLSILYSLMILQTLDETENN
jgi:carbohydrate diacid regulator